MSNNNGQNTARMTMQQRYLWLQLALLTLLLPGGFAHARENASVQVIDPYIELHTGPGRGYPVFYVEERGAWIDVVMRKTDWFKVRTTRGKEGWVSVDQLELTLSPNGQQTKIAETTIAEFRRHRWEIGVTGGDFEGYQITTLYGGYKLTPNFSVIVSASRLFSDFASGEMVDTGLVLHPFPDWRVSPLFALGTGIIKRNPYTTLTQGQDQTDQVAHMGVGAQVYLARRFVMRLQYSNYVIFQSQIPGRQDGNQEINEWKAGFAVFF